MLRIFYMQFPKPFLVLAAIELVLIVISLYVGVFISWVDFEFNYPFLIEHLPQAFGVALLLAIIMFAMGIYNDIISVSFYNIIIRLTASFLFGFSLLSALFYAVPELMIWRSVMAGSMTSAFLSVAAAHYIFLHAIDLTPLKRRILVLGTGDLAARIDALERDGHAFGFVSAGYYRTPNEPPKVSSNRIFANDEALVEIVQREKVEEIVVAVTDRRQQLPIESLVDCGFRGVAITDYSSFWERETRRVDLDTLHRGWMLFSSGFPGGRRQQMVKRAFDVAVSLVALTFLLPLIVATAIAIRLDSRGPIFYRQRRVGYGGKPFDLLKFRSMRQDAEQDGVPRWAAADDDRVTAVGAFIRQVRIDEMPQFVNVLKGEMSFVGPRPERPFFVDQLAEQIPFYRERFRVKPGISGWAQLNYPYGASVDDAAQKLQYELYYIKYCSLMMDAVILLQTARVIFWPPRR
jgi:sugar transferase (PEP-CTERM system associated)